MQDESVAAMRPPASKPLARRAREWRAACDAVLRGRDGAPRAMRCYSLANSVQRAMRCCSLTNGLPRAMRCCAVARACRERCGAARSRRCAASDAVLRAPRRRAASDAVLRGRDGVPRTMRCCARRERRAACAARVGAHPRVAGAVTCALCVRACRDASRARSARPALSQVIQCRSRWSWWS